MTMVGLEGCPLAGFQLQFTEVVDGEIVFLGPAPREFPRQTNLACAPIRQGHKTYRVTALKLREGPALVAKGEMIGLVVHEIAAPAG